MEEKTILLKGIQEQEGIGHIFDTLFARGYKACVVGGAVRDALLGLNPGDVDVLTNAPPEVVAALFSGPKTRQVGQTFSITLVNGVEVASCRGSGQEFPLSDLGMRDFTMNSMAWDPFTQTLVDPFNGRQDLKDRILRFTQSPEQRIEEDPLRMVRACRFAARYHCSIEPRSFAAVQTRKDKILTCTAGERIRMELIKAMSMDHPSKFFTLLHETGLLALILPSLDRCYGQDGGPFHGETVFEHSLLVGDALPARQPLLRLAGYLHDVGKFDAGRIKEGKLTFAGHEREKEALVKDLIRLRFSIRETQYILSLVRAHMRPLKKDSTPRAVRRLLAMLDDLDLSYQDFLRLRIADKRGNLAKSPYTLSDIRDRLGKILDGISGQTAFNINDLEISGREIQKILGLEPGPRVGEVKKYLFDCVLEDPGLNNKESLEGLIRDMPS